MELMSTTMISPPSFEGAWVGAWVSRAQAGDTCALSRLVKAFGGRVFSLAKHITQNDAAAEEVLLATFLEALEGFEKGEKLWARMVTIAAREALRTLSFRGERRPNSEATLKSREDIVIRELSVWGDSSQRWVLHEQMS